MLDVHILTLPDRQHELARCLATTESSMANVHVLDGYAGHIGRGRVQGFSTGDAPFVTYVDDDDMLVPGTLDLLARLLEANPGVAMAYVKNTTIPANSEVYPPVTKASWRLMGRHITQCFADHMCVYRRDRMTGFLPEYARWRRGGDSRIMRRYIKQKIAADEAVLVVDDALYKVCKDMNHGV